MHFDWQHRNSASPESDMIINMNVLSQLGPFYHPNVYP